MCPPYYYYASYLKDYLRSRVGQWRRVFCKAYYYFLIPASKNATIRNAMLHLFGGSRTEIGHLEWFPPVLGMCVGVINDLHCFVWIVYLLLDIRRYGMTKNFNLQFCLEGSSKVIIFETLFSLLDIALNSRFETDQIFLKHNFEIWICFSIFPDRKDEGDDEQNFGHFLRLVTRNDDIFQLSFW